MCQEFLIVSGNLIVPIKLQVALWYCLLYSNKRRQAWCVWEWGIPSKMLESLKSSNVQMQVNKINIVDQIRWVCVLYTHELYLFCLQGKQKSLTFDTDNKWKEIRIIINTIHKLQYNSFFPSPRLFSSPTLNMADPRLRNIKIQTGVVKRYEREAR